MNPADETAPMAFRESLSPMTWSFDAAVERAARAIEAAAAAQQHLTHLVEARAAYTALLERVDFLKAQTKTLASECAEARAALAAEGEPCNCGYGGFHEPENQRCNRNIARTAKEGDQ